MSKSQKTDAMVKSGRIMTIQAGDKFNNARKKGDKISKDASKNVHLNLNEMDERIKNAKEYQTDWLRSKNRQKRQVHF